MEPVNHDCGVREEDLGPYLLGHLDPRREKEVAALVAACVSCSDEVAHLREVVADMARASHPTASDEPYPLASSDRVVTDAGLDRVMMQIRRERRRGWTGRRTVALASAAAVAAITAVIVGSQLLPDPADREVVLARDASGTAADDGASGRVTLDGRSWGTSLVLEASGLSPGETYGVWLERDEGDRLTAGSFVPDSDGTVQLDLSSGLALEDSTAVGIALLPGAQMADAVDVLSARLDQPDG